MYKNFFIDLDYFSQPQEVLLISTTTTLLFHSNKEFLNHQTFLYKARKFIKQKSLYCPPNAPKLRTNFLWDTL